MACRMNSRFSHGRALVLLGLLALGGCGFIKSKLFRSSTDSGPTSNVAIPVVVDAGGVAIAIPQIPGVDGAAIAIPQIPGVDGAAIAIPQIPGLDGATLAMPAALAIPSADAAVPQVPQVPQVPEGPGPVVAAGDDAGSAAPQVPPGTPAIRPRRHSGNFCKDHPGQVNPATGTICPMVVR